VKQRESESVGVEEECVHKSGDGEKRVCEIDIIFIIQKYKNEG